MKDEDVTHLRELMAERDRSYRELLASHVVTAEAAFEAVRAAVSKAENANELRFQSVNEFRAQQSDLIARFIPRAEAQALINAGDERLQLQVLANAKSLEALTTIVNQQVIGRGIGQQATIAVVAAMVLIVGGLLGVLAYIH